MCCQSYEGCFLYEYSILLIWNITPFWPKEDEEKECEFTTELEAVSHCEDTALFEVIVGAWSAALAAKLAKAEDHRSLGSGSTTFTFMQKSVGKLS